MADYRDIFKTKASRNWIKCWVAVYTATAGLVNFVKDEIEDFHGDILRKLPPGHTICTKCSTPNAVPCASKHICIVRQGKCNFHKGVAKAYKSCPIHDIFRNEIQQKHRFSTPSWKDTKAELWVTSPTEISKCYMPPGGYIDKASIEDTDFNGLAAVILNCKRFQNLFVADLSQKVNICSEAREAVNAVRHFENMSCTTDDILNDLLHKLGDLFDDAKCLQKHPYAVHARSVFEKLKTDHVSLIDEDYTDKCFKEAMEELDKWLKSNKNKDESQAKCVQDVKGEIDSYLTKTIEEIEKVKAECVVGVKASLTQGYESFKKEFGDGLRCYYQENYSTLPLSPLVSENDERLDKFYVPPDIKQVDIKNRCDPKAMSKDIRESISSYYEIFNKGENELKNIYIQGEPGSGKSSFCLKLAVDWCNGKSDNETQVSSSSNKTPVWYSFMDADVIGEYDFLFLLCLRDVTDSCDIFKMIQDHILPEIITGYESSDDEETASQNSKYLQSILEQEKCLIVLDGLDEWSHPAGKCLRKKKSIPHRNVWKYTTIITTTRPWKMASTEIRNSDVDNLLEICGISDCGALVTRVWECLESNDDKQCSENDTVIEPFYDALKTNNLDHFMSVPMMLMQLLCLWHDSKSLGKSRCAIYTSMLETLFERANENGLLMDVPLHKVTNFEHIECMKNKEQCHQHQSHLLSLGKLAYETLTSPQTTTSLVFPDDIAKRFLSEQDLKLALTVGILSEHKTSKLSARKTTYSFLHKTFQEFLAALYVPLSMTDLHTIKTLFDSIDTADEILNLSEMFIFLCGLKPDIAEQMSAVMMNRFDEVNVYKEYWFVDFQGEALQTMVVNGFRECLDNGHNAPNLTLHHLWCIYTVIEKYVKVGNLAHCLRLWKENLMNIKTIHVWSLDNELRIIAKNTKSDFGELLQTFSKFGSKLRFVHIREMGLEVPDVFDLSECSNVEHFQLKTNLETKKHTACCRPNCAEFPKMKINAKSLKYCSLYGVSDSCTASVLTTLAAGAPELQSLWLGRIACCNILSPHLSKICVSLTDLWIKGLSSKCTDCKYADILPPPSLVNLKMLGLSEVYLTGGLDLSTCENLRKLSLCHVAMTDDLILPTFVNLTDLCVGYIAVNEDDAKNHDSNPRETVPRQVWLAVEKAPNLKVLDVQGCSNSDMMCECIEHVGSLKELSLRNVDLGICHLHVPKSIANITLCDSGIQITDESLQTLLKRVSQLSHEVEIIVEDNEYITEHITQYLKQSQVVHKHTKPYPFLEKFTILPSWH